MGSQLTNVTMVSGDDAAGEDAVLAGLRRGLGRDGISIPAYQTLGVDVREATAGSAVVRLPRSPHLVAPDGGLLPGAFAILADACCGCAVAAALPAGGAALTAQLRVEFIRPLPAGHTWIEGRAEADAVDDSSGLARAEIIDEADQLLGVASLRVIKASHQGFRQTTPRPDRAASARAASAPAAASGPAGVQAPTPAARLLGVVSRQARLRPVGLDVPPAASAANSFAMVHGGVLGLLAHEVARTRSGR